MSLTMLGRFLLISLLVALLQTEVEADSPIKRIVSLAPSVSELIYALEAEEYLVGVTTYCDYPPELKKLPKVGGYIDPSVESILVLQADLVVGLREHRETIRLLESFSLQLLVIDHNSVSGIKESFRQVGKLVDRVDKAEALVSQLEAAILRARSRVGAGPVPKVMITIGAHNQSDSASQFFVAGMHSLFDEIIQLSGGQNAYRGKVLYPKLSLEGVLAINPDVIIDLDPDALNQSASGRNEIFRRRIFQNINAVKAGRVLVLNQDYAVNPGPRVHRLIADVSSAIWPGEKAGE